MANLVPSRLYRSTRPGFLLDSASHESTTYLIWDSFLTISLVKKFQIMRLDFVFTCFRILWWGLLLRGFGEEFRNSSRAVWD